MRKRTRAWIVASALALLAAFAVAPPALAQTAPRSAEAALVSDVASIGITVADADRTAEFLTRVLDFEKVGDVEVAGGDYERLEGVFGARLRVVHMKLGAELLDLYEYIAPRGRPVPADSRSNDGWFQHVAIVVSDMDRAYVRLRENRVEHASTGPQTLPDWNPNAGGIRAFYFKDPDHHVLEVIWFPAGKGDPRWQRGDGKLFLGIDHTAIVVADTERSLGFYRDTLGMRVAGESENWGTEQEHLNGVFGARLRITGLRTERGPGIELLEYLAPRDGRPYPHDLRANDLAFWRTSLTVPDIARADSAARAAHIDYVSPGTVEMPDGKLGFARGLSVRDPDGHALQMIAR
jgi:catechol 2,3-dioxygenase-like lactoylglutathione lyase family enzyme